MSDWKEHLEWIANNVLAIAPPPPVYFWRTDCAALVRATSSGQDLERCLIIDQVCLMVSVIPDEEEYFWRDELWALIWKLRDYPPNSSGERLGELRFSNDGLRMVPEGAIWFHHWKQEHPAP